MITKRQMGVPIHLKNKLFAFSCLHLLSTNQTTSSVSSNWTSPYSRTSMAQTALESMKICSRQGLFKLISVTHSARSGGIKGISFPFSLI